MEQKVKQVRFTIDLPEPILVALKVRAAQERMSMRQIVMSALLVALNTKRDTK